LRLYGLTGGLARECYPSIGCQTNALLERFNAKGDKFYPALHYYVGGNSKVYGTALLPRSAS
jgi:hypothetical protein